MKENQEYLFVKRAILRILLRRGIIGGKHLPFSLVIRGIPKHLRKIAKEVSKDLIRKGLLLVKPKPSELHISLNPRKLDEIKKIVYE